MSKRPSARSNTSGACKYGMNSSLATFLPRTMFTPVVPFRRLGQDVRPETLTSARLHRAPSLEPTTAVSHKLTKNHNPPKHDRMRVDATCTYTKTFLTAAPPHVHTFPPTSYRCNALVSPGHMTSSTGNGRNPISRSSPGWPSFHSRTPFSCHVTPTNQYRKRCVLSARPGSHAHNHGTSRQRWSAVEKVKCTT